MDSVGGDMLQKVSPAYAGMNRWPTSWSPWVSSIPRVRGDEPAAFVVQNSLSSYPPRTLG